jgi:hypothetical protein
MTFVASEWWILWKLGLNYLVLYLYYLKCPFYYWVYLTIIDIYTDLRSADNKYDFRPYVSFTGFAFYIARDLHALWNMCCVCANQCYKENKRNFKTVKFTASGQVITITCDCVATYFHFNHYRNTLLIWSIHILNSWFLITCVNRT